MAGRGKQLKKLSDGIADASNTESKLSRTLMAKYSYKANPERPGGFDEVDLRQFEKVSLLRKGYADNPLWWEVVKADGRKGYAPAQYLTYVDEPVTSLPWLNQDPEPDSTPVGGQKFKPYTPAYSDNKKQKEYYCNVCERAFNGPIPYRAHMNSKAHKEEEQLAREYGNA